VRFVEAPRSLIGLGDVAAGLGAVAQLGPDVVVGIGGGTAMDLAKCLAVLAPTTPEGVRRAVDSGGPPNRERGLVLLPTTAGSGSEVTGFAVLWDGADKLSLDAPAVRADVALIDSDLVASVPHPVAAAAAADAFAQAVESWWAVGGSAWSRETARSALETLVPALVAACARGTFADVMLREELAWGATLAGAAIGVSRTTAAHALSYSLTARDGIPHGAAVALNLPWGVEHNRGATPDDCLLPDGVDALRAIVAGIDDVCAHAGTDPAALAGALLAAGGHPVDLAALTAEPGARAAEWTAMLDSPRMRNNPRVVTAADVSRLSRPRSSAS
jgi:alcohol dehydrogenase class IV